ncbi:hypothetical protein DFP73DRAFT_527772 [Morchella snyderi]|nr:hypothetical protein DFP73DRAFT_527772 [Morchella snyderi]
MSSDTAMPRPRYYRLPGACSLALKDILGYTRPEIHKFLEHATIRNMQIGGQEQADLKRVWESIIDPFFHDKFSDMAPVDIKVHGVLVKIVYINCAISAVLSITMTNPIAVFPSMRIKHDWALAVAVVLGALCRLGGSGRARRKARMVCVMYGSAGCGSPILVCGTSKCYLAKYFRVKNGMSNPRWRQERLEGLQEAMHGPSTSGTVALASATGVGSSSTVSLPRTAASRNARGLDRMRDGNCAETVPMMVVAGRCSGMVVSIAIRLADIPDGDWDLSRLVHRMRGSENRGSYLTLWQTKACGNCLRFFDLLEQKRGIKVVHELLSEAQYPLASLDIGC